MQLSPKTYFLSRFTKLIITCLFIFASGPTHAGYYSGYKYGHGYKHYGYSHYYPRHHYRYKHHHGYRGHYGVHGRASNTAAYVILGIIGAAVLTHIVTKNRYEDRHYRKQPRYSQTTYRKPKTYTTVQKVVPKKIVYHYRENEGWDWLAKGEANYALDIFAIQSQQNLNSGIPKVGFAIAAASMGETTRATRAMRKAIKTDPTALDRLTVDQDIKTRLGTLSDSLSYDKNNVDTAFLLSSLAYIQGKFTIAQDLLANNDKSDSANTLRKLTKQQRETDHF